MLQLLKSATDFDSSVLHKPEYQHYGINAAENRKFRIRTSSHLKFVSLICSYFRPKAPKVLSKSRRRKIFVHFGNAR